MKKGLVLFCSLVALSSCGPSELNLIQQATSAYDAVRAANYGYRSYKMVKSLKNANPIFKDYSCVKAQALVYPGQESKEKELRKAFVDNFNYMVDEYLKAAKLDNIKVCHGDSCNCTGKTLLIQFIEEGYDPNIINKITIGGRMKGTLRYVDAETKKVIRKDDLEVAKDYKMLLQEIGMSVATKAAKTAIELYPDKDPQKIVDEINKVNPIKPEYEELFKQN